MRETLATKGRKLLFTMIFATRKLGENNNRPTAEGRARETYEVRGAAGRWAKGSYSSCWIRRSAWTPPGLSLAGLWEDLRHRTIKNADTRGETSQRNEASSRRLTCRSYRVWNSAVRSLQSMQSIRICHARESLETLVGR